MTLRSGGRRAPRALFRIEGDARWLLRHRSRRLVAGGARVLARFAQNVTILNLECHFAPV